MSRSREGAWIEMYSKIFSFKRRLSVAPVRERGLKCTGTYDKSGSDSLVAPVRERGLK